DWSSDVCSSDLEPGRRSCQGAGDPGQADAAAQGAVRRDQPGPGEVCGRTARHMLRRGAPAAGAAGQGNPGQSEGTGKVAWPAGSEGQVRRQGQGQSQEKEVRL